MRDWQRFVNKPICGDAEKTLKQMPPEFVSCFMFSPPYWSLRDYKVEGQIGLEKDFNEWLVKMWAVMDEVWRVLRKDGTVWVNLGDGYYGGKGKSSQAWSTEHQDRDTLQKDWHQITSKGETRPSDAKQDGIMPKSLLMLPERFALGLIDPEFRAFTEWRALNRPKGKLEDMIRFIDKRATILRNKCLWQKPNPMPCSAKDRFTTTWEYLFFFVKSKKYWFDLDAVRRPHSPNTHPFGKGGSFEINADKKTMPSWGKEGSQGLRGIQYHMYRNPAGKNPRDVISYDQKYNQLTDKAYQRKVLGVPHDQANVHPAGANPGDFMVIPTQPSKLAHYASFPEKLVETPLKAGCPRWICKQCGKARVRVTKPSEEYAKHLGGWGKPNVDPLEVGATKIKPTLTYDYQTLGWTFCSCLCPACGEADCKCGEKWRPGVTVDPFGGTGVTCKVAKRLGLDWIYIDIKKEYCEMAEREIKRVSHQEILL